MPVARGVTHQRCLRKECSRLPFAVQPRMTHGSRSSTEALRSGKARLTAVNLSFGQLELSPWRGEAEIRRHRGRPSVSRWAEKDRRAIAYTAHMGLWRNTLTPKPILRCSDCSALACTQPVSEPIARVCRRTLPVHPRGQHPAGPLARLRRFIYDCTVVILKLSLQQD